MVPEITDLQKRRAENLIWNSAGSYSFTPDFKAYDRNGQADLYWNCIIGAVRKLYAYPKLEAILRSFQQYEECDIYEGLFWLGLENSVFYRELKGRPVLADLRNAYAARYVHEHSGRPANDLDFLGRLSLAHWQRVLGQKLSLSKTEIQLLDELEFSPNDDTDAIVKKASALFLQWFQIITEEKNVPVLPRLGKAEGHQGVIVDSVLDLPIIRRTFMAEFLPVRMLIMKSRQRFPLQSSEYLWKRNMENPCLLHVRFRNWKGCYVQATIRTVIFS